MGWLTVSDTPERRANLASMRSHQADFDETLAQVNRFSAELQALNRAGRSSQSNLSQVAGDLGEILTEQVSGKFELWNTELEGLREKLSSAKQEHYNTFLKQYEVPVIWRKGFQSGKTLVERSFDMSFKSQLAIKKNLFDIQAQVTVEKALSVPPSSNRSSNAGPSNT